MARWEPEQTVTQSVLDRLIDRDPASNSEASLTRVQSVRQLKVSLRRDLEWLLNSRRTPDAVGREFQELEQSLYNYGLPDVTSLSWDSAPDGNSRGRGARDGRCATRDAVSDRGDAGNGPHARAHLFRHLAATLERRVSGQGGFRCGMTCCSTTSVS